MMEGFAWRRSGVGSALPLCEAERGRHGDASGNGLLYSKRSKTCVANAQRKANQGAPRPLLLKDSMLTKSRVRWHRDVRCMLARTRIGPICLLFSENSLVLLVLRRTKQADYLP